MKATFTIEYRTEWGESLSLVAGGKKYPMTWGDGGLWRVEIDPCPKALLQKYGCNALGLSGCDAGVIRARRRGPKILSDGFTKMDFGYVGDVSPSSFNVPFIRDLIAGGIVPVFCPINHDGQGQLFNTNADTIAGSLAAALCAGLVFCFEKKGVLYDKEDDDSVIPALDEATYAQYKQEGRIDKGMVPKLDNAFGALQKGASKVVIKHALDLLEDTGTVLG